MTQISKINGIPVINTFVTGGTYDGNDIINFINNDGGTFSVTGITDFYTTGTSYINDTIFFDRNDQLSAYTFDVAQITGTTSNAVSIGLEWIFLTNTSATDPTNKKFKANNTIPSAVTEIYYSDITNGGVDASNIINNLNSGSIIYIQQKDNSSSSTLYNVIGNPIDNTSWWTVPVAYDSGESLPSNNKKAISIFFGVGPNAAWGSIGGTLSAQTDLQTELSSHDYLMSSSIITGGSLSIGVDPTKFDVESGSGFIVNQKVNPTTVTPVSWSGFTGQTVTSLSASFSTDIAINLSGSIVQQNSFSNEELRELVFLGGIDHSNLTDISNTFNIQNPIQSTGSSLKELSNAVGDINLNGNIYGPNGTNLLLNKTSGDTFSYGKNNTNNIYDPHTILSLLQTGLTFSYVYNNGSGFAIFTSGTTLVNPENFDDGSGTLANVPPNDWTIQRVLYFPNSKNTFLQYGPETYNTKTGALNAVPRAGFVSFPGIRTASIRGYIIIKDGETDLTSSDTEFLDADKFGSVASLSSAGVSTTWGTITGALSSHTDLNTALDDTTLILTTTLSSSRALVIGDRNTNIENSNNITITVPENASVAFPVGTQVFFTKKSEGLAFTPTGAVTINSIDGFLEIGRINSSASLLKIDTDEWNLIGELL